MLRNSGPTVSMNALVAFAIIVCGLSTFGGGGVLHHQQKKRKKSAIGPTNMDLWETTLCMEGDQD